MSSPGALAPSAATGGLGVCHLERLWSAAMLARGGRQPERPGEEDLDRVVLTALGLGLHPALPHGSRPNPGDRPRIVQSVNLMPGLRVPVPRL